MEKHFTRINAIRQLRLKNMTPILFESENDPIDNIKSIGML